MGDALGAPLGLADGLAEGLIVGEDDGCEMGSIAKRYTFSWVIYKLQHEIIILVYDMHCLKLYSPSNLVKQLAPASWKEKQKAHQSARQKELRLDSR